MDRILIEGLEIQSLIGVYAWERDAKTPLLLDVELYTNLTAAALSDNVTDTINYAEVANKLVELADKSQFQLLEALAGAMLDDLMSHYSLHKAKVKLSKPNILDNARNVAVELSREAVN